MNTTTQTIQDKTLADICIEKIIAFVREKREREKTVILKPDTRSEKAKSIEKLLPKFECHREAVAELISLLLGEKIKAKDDAQNRDYSLGKVFVNGSNICLSLTKDNYPIAMNGETKSFHNYKEATEDQFEEFMKNLDWKKAFTQGSFHPFLKEI